MPHVTPEFLETLTDLERLVLPYAFDLWLRPNQRVPTDRRWLYYGFISGRGYGKTTGIAVHVNREVESGVVPHVALMAPTAERVKDVQFKALIDFSPPWFRPVEHCGGLRWPNGVRAVAFTPEAPGRSRSENIGLTWLTEIVDWQASTRMDAFNNLTTATRIGKAQVVWDTTSKGRNDVIRHLEKLHAGDPMLYPIQRGQMFDNPLLDPVYLRTECQKYSGRRYEEEIEGKVFAESAGALFEEAWLEDNRVDEMPDPGSVVERLVAADPALSSHENSDETGIVTGSRTADGDVFVESDLSGKHTPEQWGDIIVSECLDNHAAGAVVERNAGGDHIVFTLRSRAMTRNAQVREISTDQSKPFPRRTPGVIYVRSLQSRAKKTARAEGPSSECSAGNVHLVGRFPQLEDELTTYEPGVSQSPNRYDAFNMLITELRGLGQAKPRSSVKTETKIIQEANMSIREKLRRAGRGGQVGL